MNNGIVRLADVPSRQRGWSNHELAQFHRVIADLWSVGLALETDSGVTDEGDPWFVFCDDLSDEIFAHFARIGREYVVCAPWLNRLLTGTILRELVDHFIDPVSLLTCGVHPQPFYTCRAIAPSPRCRDRQPLAGVLVRNFVTVIDPTFPAPSQSVYKERRHVWVPLSN